MSDTQPNHDPSDEVEVKGGWKKPNKVSGWKAPQPEPPPSQTGGWRVPAMPPELDVTPAREGSWHLPRPEDTTFGPEDEVEVRTEPALRPEDMALDEEDEEETAEAPQDVLDQDEMADLESYSGLGELVASLTTIMEAQPKPRIVPGAAEEEDTAEAVEVTESEDFGPTLAEREALSQAAGSETTEVHPADYARQRVDWQAADTDEEAETADAALDPAAYARQQLEALETGQEPTAPATEAEPTASDPAAYARQQLAQLGGVSTTEPEAEQELADPAQVELARKFRETERQVRALRQQYRNGLITRDQLQEQLRQQLILDLDDNWWMMGVDTDTWYRYDNNTKEWVVDTPPVAPARGVPTATSEFTADEVLRGQLPYLPEDEEREATAEDTAFTRGTEPYYVDEDMPLPRPGVPITDLEATIPGASAINQHTTRLSDAQTLDSGFGPQPTIRAEPVETTPYEPTMGYETVAVGPPAFDELDEESSAYRQAVERQRQSTMRRLILAATLFFGGVFIIGTLVVLAVVISYNSIASQYTAQINALENYEPAFETVRVLDAAGNLLAELSSEEGGSRESISLEEMSPELIFAIVGAQNPRFYETSGFDVLTIADAFVQNLGGGPRGIPTEGLTITQEIAARLVVANSPNAATATRLDVIVAASEVARRYNHNFILELYLNEQFFGNQSYGVQAASNFYFDKPASQVNLVEGAMLAALLRNPVDNDPVPKENRDKAFAVADEVLRELANVGCLNFQHAQYGATGENFCVPATQILRASGEFTANINLQRAQLQTLPLRPRSAEGRYPHFVDYVRRELTREYGDEMFRRGFQVRTTLVTDIQDVAERALRDQLRAQAFTGLQTGAVVVANPSTGEILAMVGSPDFNNVD
ncbi:MAG TPA: transglycosylase domain-containing protein, partial [Spirillospora sp.]|nr:transglycosylase domain-containing protein [Spirillospora sp.]